MKKNVVIGGLAVVVLIIMSAFISISNPEPGITGSIDPPDGASKVWAISGADSVSAMPVEGKFSLDVKAGTWQLLVEGVKPYKNAAKENIVVLEGQATDVGVIKLESE